MNSVVKCNVPVLLVAFNRLHTVQKTFEIIRKVQPPKLYIACDGARVDRKGENDKVEQIKNYLVSSVDWNCEVKTQFQDKNLGCGLGPYEAKKWFFTNEEMGILLEDDVVPNLSFFPYCEELLQRYRYDTRISMIGGFNFFDKGISSNTYYFSRYVLTSGAFASWRRAWKDYDFGISKWEQLKETDFIHKAYPQKHQAEYYAKTFDDVFSGNRNDAWDYQWSFLNLINDWKCILPCCNLVKNMGFGEDATHTISTTDNCAKLFANLPDAEIYFPIKHPVSFHFDFERDNKFLEMQVIKPLSVWQKIKREIKRVFKRKAK
ncbi:MAG: hemolysin hemolytic protein [Bacteroidales bacterium]|jgi:hypothetical protein|nr:hemolysin hemolytic protein [Bacteroidales bacterium]